MPSTFAITPLCQRMDLLAESGLTMAEVDALTPEALATWTCWLEIRRVRRVREMTEAFAVVLASRRKL